MACDAVRVHMRNAQRRAWIQWKENENNRYQPMVGRSVRRRETTHGEARKSAAIVMLTRRGALVTNTPELFVRQPNSSKTLPSWKRLLL